MKLETTVIINSNIEKVWENLTDFQKYPEWNPFITRIEGTIECGEVLHVDINPPGAKKNTFKPLLMQYDKNKEMRWIGCLGASWLFQGEHYFKLESTDNN